MTTMTAADLEERTRRRKERREHLKAAGFERISATPIDADQNYQELWGKRASRHAKYEQRAVLTWDGANSTVAFTWMDED